MQELVSGLYCKYLEGRDHSPFTDSQIGVGHIPLVFNPQSAFTRLGSHHSGLFLTWLQLYSASYDSFNLESRVQSSRHPLEYAILLAERKSTREMKKTHVMILTAFMENSQLYKTFALISLPKTSHMVKPDARCAEFTFPKEGVVSHMTIHQKWNILIGKGQ